MAIFHLHAQAISRGKGASAAAAAAYRFGSSITDTRTGVTHDYTRKRRTHGGEVFAPVEAPSWVFDVPQLVQQVDAAEKRKDAQLFREIVVALPAEIPHEKRRELVADFVSDMTARGIVCAVAYHGKNTKNPHAHILQTTRELGPEGFGKKQRDWNEKEVLEAWRQRWSTSVNAALAAAVPSAAPVSHLSHAARGLDELPTIHEGRKQREAHAKGLPAPAVEINTERKRLNRLRRLLAEALGKLQQLDKAESLARAGFFGPLAVFFQSFGVHSMSLGLHLLDTFTPTPPEPPKEPTEPSPVSETISVTPLPKNPPEGPKRPPNRMRLG